jgi:hypothetical protein
MSAALRNANERAMVARARARKRRKALYDQYVDLAQGHDDPDGDARF